VYVDTDGISLVALLCTFSNTSMSAAKLGLQVGAQYSKCGQTSVSYNIIKDEAALH